jgi:hypothetical protein
MLVSRSERLGWPRALKRGHGEEADIQAGFAGIFGQIAARCACASVAPVRAALPRAREPPTHLSECPKMVECYWLLDVNQL